MKSLLLLLIPLALLGCDDTEPTASTKVGGNGVYAYLRTVTHDGHMFVVGTSSSSSGGCSVVHHPACECLKVR